MQVLKNDREEKPDIKNLLLATHNFKRVLAICNDAHHNKKMVAVVGEPGMGKSKALQYYRDTNKNVFYMTVKASMTANDFWLSFFDQVPGRERAYFGMNTRRPLYFMIKAVSEYLNTYDSALLIIDEAGKFNPRQLEFLHDVKDNTLLTTGIVLAGPPYFMRNLTKWTRSEKRGMTEVFRRINYWEQLSPIDKSEIKEFCRHFEVFDQDVVRALTMSCTSYGMLTNRLVEYHSGRREL